MLSAKRVKVPQEDILSHFAILNSTRVTFLHAIHDSMARSSWAQQAVEEFFQHRQIPQQAGCDEKAKGVTGARSVRSVDAPGTFSYTVICSDCSAGQDVIVSFREPEALLKVDTMTLAKNIHGPLVPQVTDVGVIKDANPLLRIYIMQYLPGVPCLNIIRGDVHVDAIEQNRHCAFMKSLARYKLSQVLPSSHLTG